MVNFSIDLTFDDFDQAEDVYDEIQDILKVSSDYQHRNLILSCDLDTVSISAFPNDFVDMARSRTALKGLFDYIYEKKL